MTDNAYERLSTERKKLQTAGEMQDWWSTGAWQLFKGKYLYNATTPREQYQRIAKTLAQYVEGRYPDWWEAEFGPHYTWEQAFFDQMWCGNLSGSSPVISNTGTDRGMSVSCSGNVVPDSVFGIYEAKKEVAVLTKEGFGTASYIGNILARGEKSARGVVSNGIVPWIKTFVLDMEAVSQGSNRRGAWAAYVEMDHGDFFELAHYLKDAQDGLNVGWLVKDRLVQRLVAGDADANERFKTALFTKSMTGKGYYSFIDKINRRRPQMYVDRGLYVVAPQLCNEIHLHSSEDITYTCVLASQNAARYPEWKHTKAVFISTVFLDCVAEDFIQKAKCTPGLEKAVRFTQLGRALGLGVCGYHTYMQKNMIPFDSIEAYAFNNELFKHIEQESLKASQWMAKELGEPEWCKGYGVRNTHRLAVAPTKSSAILMAGISEGINPDTAMTFLQLTPAGEIDRANPILLELMKQRGVYDDKHMLELTQAQGSVQGVPWLNDHEKRVFRTAFEIDMHDVLKQGSMRQRRLCQGQSLNLYLSAEEDEEYIAELHAGAFEDELCLGLYYNYSKAGVTASKECEACQ